MAELINSLLSGLNNFVSKIGSLLTGRGSSNGNGGQLLPPKPGSAEKFPNFVIVSTDENLFKNRTPGNAEDIEDVASKIGEKIRAALDKHYKNNIGNFETIEIYVLNSAAALLNSFFNRPDAISEFEKICAGKIWIDKTDDDSQKVIFFRRALKYDAYWQTKIGSGLLVRPINSGGSAPSLDTETTGESYQFLIGDIQVQNRSGNIVAQTPLRVWRSRSDEHSYTLHLDFDVLSKVFAGQYHKIPLGIVLSCSTIIENGARQIENVTLSLEETNRWGTFLNNSVQYFIHTGYGRTAQENNVQKIGSTLVAIDESPPNHHHTVDGLIKVTRRLVFMAKTKNADYKYILRFFNRASKFDPKNNYLSLTGQLIRSGQTEIVYTPPSFSAMAEEVFQITPDSAQSRSFKIWSRDKELKHRPVQGAETDIEPDTEFTASFGDEITYTPRSAAKGDIRSFMFRLGETNAIPPDIRNQRNFACLVEINPGEQTRVSQLLKEHHELGGGSFLASTTGISKKAVIFDRPYAQITVKKGDNEDVWIVDRVNNPNLESKKVEGDGEDLALNGRYEIYVDCFRLELNLSTTPLNL